MNKNLKWIGIVIFIILAVWLYMLHWKLDDYRNLAVIVGTIIALIVYITNSYFQYKHRISENAIRYMKLHDELFENEFLKNNIQAMEKGGLKREEKDEEKFNRLLGKVEHLAFLSKTGVVSNSLNIYMFGWFARHIQPLITKEERDNVYWEVAVKFLDDLKADADDFYMKDKKTREEYYSKNHFFH